MPKRIEILVWWMASHGRLTERHRQAFLERDEVRQLARMPSPIVKRAIARYRKLDSILTEARRLQPGLISLDPRPPEDDDRLAGPLADTEDLGNLPDVLLGVLYGDCLGAPYEFGSPDPSRPLAVGASVFGHPPGRGTDDTETTLAVACGLLDAAEADGHLDDPCEHIAERLLAWLATGPADVGSTTRAGLDNYRRTFDPITSGGTSERAISNGSLMRSAPFVLAYSDPAQAATAAARSSMVTHAHPVVLDCVTAYVSLLGSLLGGKSPETAERPTGACEAFQTAVDHLDQQAGSIPCPGIGYAPYALTLAYWAAMSPLADPFTAGIEHVIRAGGDTDTNGAICGAVLAARHGFPGTLVRDLDQRRVHEVIDLTERLFAVRR